MSSTLVIGTRGSPLALAQTALVQAAIAARCPDVSTSVVRISTRGDRVQDRPLAEIGGKALFVEEIETALRSGAIDLAVHSGKDIPSDLPADMRIAGYLPRADVRDALISRNGLDLRSLPHGARIGTSSPRRACQLRALRPDLDLRDIRGNVDTRLAKLAAGEFEAIVLAAAGLARLGLLQHVTEFMSVEDMLPCAAQGAIALEVCATNTEAQHIALLLDDTQTSTAVRAERAFLEAIGGSCSSPLAAYATVNDTTLHVVAMIGSSDGQAVHGTRSGDAANAEQIGRELAMELMERGGERLLRADPTFDYQRTALHA